MTIVKIHALQEMKQQVQILANSDLYFVFLLLVMFDVFVGILSAFTTKSLDSRIGIKGMVKHSGIILLVTTLSLILPIFHYGYIARITKIFYIVQYIISILENFDMLGIPIPPIIKAQLERLKEHGEETEVLKND